MAKKTRAPDTPQQAMLRQITGELEKNIKTEADPNKILNQSIKITFGHDQIFSQPHNH